MMASDFIHKLPKAELHLHLEGSVEPATLAELSRRHTAPLPWPGNRYQHAPADSGELTESDVAELYRYKNFEGFLMAFKAVSSRLRTPDDYELITYNLMRRLQTENVLHAEVYVSAGIVHWRGQEFAPIFEGIERGRARGEKDFGISVLWIIDAVRHFGSEAVQRVVEEAAALRKTHASVVGIGIGGNEAQGPAETFQDIYGFARQNGLRLTAHAGESVGPESIWGALNIGAERIGHGLNARQDSELMAVLAERQIPIEICISSNLRTGCCTRMQDHPVRHYFESGLMITLNSDDPPMFNTTLEREYQIAQQEFEFTDEQLRELARNSFEASFLPPEKKVAFLRMIDAFQ